MGLSITHTINTFQFENKENLKNSARDILQRQGADSEHAEKIIEKTIFDYQTQRENLYNPQLAIIKASAQISANKSLKETLKYLKNNASKKNQKKHILGEIWNSYNNNKEDFEYSGELIDFIIDSSVKNIFEAA